MSIQNRSKLLLTLVVVIFLAGCTGQLLPQSQSSQTGNGISIISFAPDIDKINSGSKVSLNLIMENTGESDANDISAEIIGLDGWDIQPSRTQTTDNLFAADLVNKFKGGQAAVVWTVQSPSKDFDQTYQLSTKVYYTYQTVASAQFKVISFDYYKTLPQETQNTEKQGVISQSYTSGPLKVTVTTQTILPQEGIIPIEIVIENTGGGKVFKGGDRPLPSTIDFLSADVSGVETCKNMPPANVDVKLTTGSSVKLKCNLSVSGVSSVTIIPIDIKLNYRYMIEKQSSLTVTKNIQ